MLQDANNFYLGTGIVSRLYMGETLVWSFSTETFWNFTENPFGKTISGFRITYTNGNVRADWGDGNVSGINSNINYNHTFQPYTSPLIQFTLYSGNVCMTSIPPPGVFRTGYSSCSNIFQLGCKVYSDPNGTIPLADGPYTDPDATYTFTIFNGDVIFTGLCV